MKTTSWKRKAIAFVLVLCLLCSVAAAAGSDAIKVFLKGSQLTMTDVNGKEVAPILQDGTTYIPARAVSEALGLDVVWDAVSRSVKISGVAPYYRTENDYDLIPITMSMQAGSKQYESWTSGMMTIHSGIGYMDPFGVGSYHAGIGYKEAEQFPLDQYFSDWFMGVFDTSLFCVYHLADGDIYAWDGIFGAVSVDDSNSKPADEAVGSAAGRGDVLVNVIVGGTGAYKGATGILVGTTSGAGSYAKVTDQMVLPEALFKLMSGYIKLPKNPDAYVAPAVTQKLSEDAKIETPAEYAMIPMEMRMQAGHAQYAPWSSGMWTIHSGIGLMKPFGSASYHAGIGYDEAKAIPAEGFFNSNWLEEFDTGLFCIYHIDDGNVKGDLYVYDGIFGAMLNIDDGSIGSQAQRQDALINIVVGGTGDFEGATGILLGKTMGSGEYAKVGANPMSGADYTLPEGLLKLMSGYIKVPATSKAAAYGENIIK